MFNNFNGRLNRKNPVWPIDICIIYFRPNETEEMRLNNNDNNYNNNKRK